MISIPQIGLGTSRQTDIEYVIPTALEVGYRHFDYKNEKEIGKALSKYIESSEISRKDLFITTKLWPTDFRKEYVAASLKKSLEDLNVDYVDLYLVHWPFAFVKDFGTTAKMENGFPVRDNVPISETWKEMEKLVKKGLARNIGVSNFGNNQLKEILEICEIKPVVNQFECHPYLPEFERVEFCHANDIQIVAYSPFGSGREPRLLSDTVLNEIALENNCSVPAVILSWLKSRGICVIPKSGNKERLQSNLETIDLSSSQINRINGIKIQHRYFDSKNYWNIEYGS